MKAKYCLCWRCSSHTHATLRSQSSGNLHIFYWVQCGLNLKTVIHVSAENFRYIPEQKGAFLPNTFSALCPSHLHVHQHLNIVKITGLFPIEGNTPLKIKGKWRDFFKKLSLSYRTNRLPLQRLFKKQDVNHNFNTTPLLITRQGDY